MGIISSFCWRSVVCDSLFVPYRQRLFIVKDGRCAIDALFKGDECLGSGNAIDMLNAVIDQRHEVLVVAGIDLNHHRVVSSGEMALDNLLDFEQFRHHVAIHGTSFKGKSDKRAGGIAQQFGVHIVARTAPPRPYGAPLLRRRRGVAAPSFTKVSDFLKWTQSFIDARKAVPAQGFHYLRNLNY